MADTKTQAGLKSIFSGLSVLQVLQQVVNLLNVHWSDTTEGCEQFDPLPNPKRYLIFSPKWLPKMFYRYIDCGQPGGNT